MRNALLLTLLMVVIALIIWKRREIFRLKRRTRRKINRSQKPLGGLSILLEVLLGVLGLFSEESLSSILRNQFQPLITRIVPSAPPLPNWLWISFLLVPILLVGLLIVLLGTRLLS